MSRASDLKALKELKNNLNEAEAFAQLAKEEWDRANEIKAEMDNTKFIFNPLPTNNEQTAKEGFVAKWKKIFTNTAMFKSVFLGIYSLAMLIMSVLLLVDLFGSKGAVFQNATALWAENGGIEFLIVSISTIVFFLSATFLPWILVKNKLPDSLQGILYLMLGGIAVGGLLFWYTADYTDAMHILFSYPIATAGAFVIGLFIHLVCIILSKIPMLSAKQKTALEKAKRQDAENAEANRVNEPKEREAWEAWWAEERAKRRETGLEHISRGDIAMEKAKAHLAAAEESDILGNSEKDGEIIDCLIHFIESRRADSVKEALHEYDTMKQNQKMLEVEAIKAQIEIEKAKKENLDRQHQMEQDRRHQLEMEAQARRSAELQSQIAANTAAAAASAERMRKDAAAAAADAAATQARVAADVAALYRTEYYNQ